MRGADVDFEDDSANLTVETARSASSFSVETAGSASYTKTTVVPQKDFRIDRGIAPPTTKKVHSTIVPIASGHEDREFRVNLREMALTGESHQQPKSDAELEMMKLGRRYEGLQVWVGGKTRFKGIRGVVIGDHDSEERAKRLEKARKAGKEKWWDQEGILLTIREEGSNHRVENVPIASVYHELWVFVGFMGDMSLTPI